MARISVEEEGGSNVTAFLDTIAFTEGTSKIGKDDGYNVLVGGNVFTSYAKHPDIKVWLPAYKVYSTAAGRYQILFRIWTTLQARLKLEDFSPINQDRAAIELMREVGAIKALQDGNLDLAVKLCSHIWASLPYSQYGQRVVAMENVHAFWLKAGGVSADSTEETRKVLADTKIKEPIQFSPDFTLPGDSVGGQLQRFFT